MKKPKVTIQDLLRKEGKGQTGYERNGVTVFYQTRWIPCTDWSMDHLPNPGGVAMADLQQMVPGVRITTTMPENPEMFEAFVITERER